MPTPEQQVAATIDAKNRETDLPLHSRGELVILACQSSSDIEAARLENGIPPTTLAPWPVSTWGYQKLWTQQIQHAD